MTANRRLRDGRSSTFWPPSFVFSIIVASNPDSFFVRWMNNSTVGPTLKHPSSCGPAGCLARMQVGLPNFIEQRFTPARLPEFALNALSNSPLENHYKQLCRRFESSKMRALLSFQDLYVGEFLVFFFRTWRRK